MLSGDVAEAPTNRRTQTTRRRAQTPGQFPVSEGGRESRLLASREYLGGQRIRIAASLQLEGQSHGRERLPSEIPSLDDERAHVWYPNLEPSLSLHVS